MRRDDLTRLLLATTATLAGAGCGFFRTTTDGPPRPPMNAAAAASQPVDDVTVQTSSGRVAGLLQPLSRPVAQGPLPLFYLVEAPLTLRVTNTDTGEDVTTLDVRPPQILRVESRGVVLDGKVVLGAQLAPGTYAIAQMSSDAGVVRTTQTRVTASVPRQAPPAASQPAVEPDATPPPASDDPSTK